MNQCLKRILDKKGVKYTDPEYSIEFSVNRNQIKYEPNTIPPKYFGFEWKVLDQYPTKYINNITLFIILLTQWLDNNRIDVDDTFNCLEYEAFLENILFQGWNTSLDINYFRLIQKKLGLVELDYNTLNKYRIEKTCKGYGTKKGGLIKKEILKWINYKNISSYSKKRINKLSKKKLLSILCKNYKETIPNCYSFIQGIFHYLYEYFLLEDSDTWIIDRFFPNFKKNIYNKINFIPNINVMTYNQMLRDYQKYYPEKFNRDYKKVKKNNLDEDYMDLYVYENLPIIKSKNKE
jgi:hypothetical protein